MRHRIAPLLIALALLPARADDAKSAFAIFGRAQGHAWRSTVPGLDRPAARLELEGKGGALTFAASPGADRYLVYFFDRAPAVTKGEETRFWSGDLDGFVIGVHVEPRKDATSFTIVDPNALRAWSHAYVYAVDAKERKPLAATWREGAKETGADGTTLPVRYRTPGAGGKR